MLFSSFHGERAVARLTEHTLVTATDLAIVDEINSKYSHWSLFNDTMRLHGIQQNSDGTAFNQGTEFVTGQEVSLRTCVPFIFVGGEGHEGNSQLSRRAREQPCHSLGQRTAGPRPAKAVAVVSPLRPRQIGSRTNQLPPCHHPGQKHN